MGHDAPTQADTGALQVYYDGGCPVCAREIAFYRGRRTEGPVAWVDVAAAAEDRLGPGMTREAALARIHVRRPDGSLVTGAAAFAELWRQMPGFRTLGRIVATPPFGTIAELGYRAFLRVRRLWR